MSEARLDSVPLRNPTPARRCYLRAARARRPRVSNRHGRGAPEVDLVTRREPSSAVPPNVSEDNTIQDKTRHDTTRHEKTSEGKKTLHEALRGNRKQFEQWENAN